MSIADSIAAAGQKVFEMFGAVGADHDNVATGEAADEALRELEYLLLTVERQEAGQ